MNEPIILDMSQAKREGKPRVYEETSPTLAARDYKEPRLAMIPEGMQSIYQDTWTKGESNGMKVNSFFCGAGGFDLGFIQAGFEIAGAWDFDKYAVESYNHNIGGAKQADVTQMTGVDVPKANGWLFGFPCQDISVAGKQAGMIKGETRSGLFYEIMRLLEEVEDKPEWILAENVKAVKKFIPTIEEEYDKSGYTLVQPQLYNSKYWGVPQNRERYFLLGIRKDLNKLFTFPQEQKEKLMVVEDFLESEVDEKYFIHREMYEQLTIDGDTPVVGTLDKNVIKADGTVIKDKNTAQWVYGTNKRMGTLSARDYKQPKQILVSNVPKLSSILESNVDEKYYIDDLKAAKIIEQAMEGLRVKQATKKGYDVAVEGDSINISHPNSKTRRGRVGKQVAQTLLTGTEQVVVMASRGRYNEEGKVEQNYEINQEGVTNTLTSVQKDNYLVEQPQIEMIVDNYRIRKLTPREYARLQGFPESYEQVVSNSQFYKQMGNAVTVNVSHAIAKAIKEQL